MWHLVHAAGVNSLLTGRMGADGGGDGLAESSLKEILRCGCLCDPDSA